MILELIRPYIWAIKAGGLALVVVCAAGYYTYTVHTIHALRDQIETLTETLEECRDEQARLKSSVDLRDYNLRILDEYYRGNKPIDKRDGELTPEEILDATEEK